MKKLHLKHRFYKTIHSLLTWLLTIDWNYESEEEKQRDYANFQVQIDKIWEDVERTRPNKEPQP